MAVWPPDSIHNEKSEGTRMKLQGKVALITGGASGLGEAIAHDFVKHGALVAIVDVNADAASRVANDLIAAGGKAIALVLDVSDETQVPKVVAEVAETLGPIDILVNSAGIARLIPFLDVKVEDFDLVHNINVRGSFLVAQEVAKRMVGRGGNIINIASASGRRGNYGRTVYGTGKAGIIRMTEIMAVELAEHNIRVNVIAPGPIETPIVAGQMTEEGKKSWTNVVPMARWGQPEEIATATSFLASDEASFITGHCLDVDGGYFAGGILKL
jgi:3-oxoacyl-[acyl-carrier protein] reductase